jgi:hypothetical protein
MPARTRGGVLVACFVVVAAAIFAPKLVDRMGSAIANLVGANDPVIVGEGDSSIMVAKTATPNVAPCTTTEILQTRKCGDLKFVIIDAAKMPFIARNIQLAWSDGHPFALRRDSTARPANYKKSCQSGFVKKYPQNGSCDEYPFASTREGGESARTEEVHRDEQNCQGGTLSRAYQDRPIVQGEQFVVIISHPDKMAGQAWQGEEIRPMGC